MKRKGGKKERKKKKRTTRIEKKERERDGEKKEIQMCGQRREKGKIRGLTLSCAVHRPQFGQKRDACGGPACNGR